jgi:thiamine biosynthesis lipoprotein
MKQIYKFSLWFSQHLVFELIAAIVLSSFLVGCSAPVPEHTEFFAMDTVCDIAVYGDAQGALVDAEACVNRLDALLSINSPDGDIFKINAAGGGKVSPETQEIIGTALDIYVKTGGAFDISLLTVTQAWGFIDGDYHVPDDALLQGILQSTGCDKVHMDDAGAVRLDAPEVQLDLGGIAKGYVSDAVANLLRSKGVKSALISLGGNVYALGTKPGGERWKIAIADPFGVDEYACIVSVANRSVITSGDYQRYFEADGKRYHHILDPKTGYPADNGLVSVTVIGEQGIMCDALSTAFFVMGAQNSLDYWREHRDEDFDLVLIGRDGSITITAGIADVFSCDGVYEVVE